MIDIVGIRFKKAGKVYYFDPAGIDLQSDDYAVVQTTQGSEIGQVVISPKQVPESEITNQLKPVIRKADEADVARIQEFTAKEKEALTSCSEYIERFNLPMKLLSAEYNMDGSRLTFFFTAEERVDFRRLVKELNITFKTRVELRQIGPRDETKLIGGLGRCGRPLCCATFLSNFNPVSIKMAKEQELPLDPMKISGICGRLMCCLGYESKQYREIKEKMPKRNQYVSTSAGNGKVLGHNTIKETVIIQLESQANIEVPLSQITNVEKPDQQEEKQQPEKSNKQ